MGAAARSSCRSGAGNSWDRATSLPRNTGRHPPRKSRPNGSPPCGSAGHAQPVLPAQRRSERVALLERIELLHEILAAQPLGLNPERAPTVLKPGVEIVAVYAAEICRPVPCFRGRAALDVGIPARRAGVTALGLD